MLMHTKIEGVVTRRVRHCHAGSVPCLIIQSIINPMVAQDKTIQWTMSLYIDDIFINECVHPVACVRKDSD